MDPRGNPLARIASTSAFRPAPMWRCSTPCSHVIIAEGLTDRLHRRACRRFRGAGRRRSRDFSPEAMAPICGIDAGDHPRRRPPLCRAERHHLLGHGRFPACARHRQCPLPDRAGADHRPDRPRGHRAASLRGQNNVQGASDAGLIPMFYPDYHPVENAGAPRRLRGGLGPRARSPAASPSSRSSTPSTPGRSAHADHGREPGDVRSRPGHARKALARLDHLVVQDIFLTETAWHADVVLPASAHAEKLGTFTNTNRRCRSAAPPCRRPARRGRISTS
jgi:formate dehydrogenase major subunit